MRRIYYIIILIGLSSCPPEGPDPYPGLLPKYVLTFYEENKQLAQTFEYNEKDQLIKQTFLDEDEIEIRTIQFVYKEDGYLDSVYIRQDWFPRNLKFHYEDTLISEWEVWNNGNRFVQQVFIKRDDQGRIIKISRMSFDLGEAQTFIFFWEGPNISRYEYTWFGDSEMTFVHELNKYDNHINPYYSTFEKIGFHFDYDFPIPLPVSKNNTLEEVSYQKINPESTKVEKNSQHFYVGEYPYIRETHIKEGGGRREIYGVFRMKKIIPTDLVN